MHQKKHLARLKPKSKQISKMHRITKNSLRARKVSLRLKKKNSSTKMK